MQYETPILLLIFNRPETTQLVFERIRKIQPKYLFVAADGPRTNKEGEKELTEITRQVILDSIDWDCELETLFRTENLGLRLAISGAIEWFFSKVEMGIILEDDILPSPDFFQFMAEMLPKYQANEQIISINGHNLGFNFDASSYTFSNYFNMWGWATWRRSLKYIDYSMNQWDSKSKLMKKWTLIKLFGSINFDKNWVDYWLKHFDYIAQKKVDAWDYQWVYSILSQEKLVIVPGANLTKNIGFNETASHTTSPDHPIAYIETSQFNFPIQHPSQMIANKSYENDFVKKIWCSIQPMTLSKFLKNKLLYIQFIYKINELVKNKLR